MHSAPTLLLIHGWGFGPAVWRPLCDCLGRHGHTVLTPALPGYAGEPAGEPLQRLGALLEGERRVIVIGWSLGGLLAIELALKWPERITALGLIAALPRFGRSPDWSAGWSAAALAAVRARLDRDAAAARRYIAALAADGDRSRTAVRQGLLATSAAGAATLRAGLDYLACADRRADFACLRQPVAVWLGAADAVLGTDCAPAVRDLRPEARVTTLAGSGHAPLLGRAPEIAETIRQEWL